MDIDETNIKIISALISNPNTRSKALSRSERIPLSTIQRRRTILERTILIKQYTVNLKEFGWRTGDLFVSVEKAKSDEVAQELLSDANVMSTSTRVGDLDVNVSARVYYKSTEELHRLVEKTKSMPDVKDVEWSEEVKMYHREQDVMIGAVFHHDPQESKKPRTTTISSFFPRQSVHRNSDYRQEYRNSVMSQLC